MRSGQPRLGKEAGSSSAPQAKQPDKALGEKRRKVLGGAFPRERCASTAGKVGRRREIQTETDRDPVAAAFEQDSGKLIAKEHQVVGPFQHQRALRRGDVDGLDQSQAGCKRQGRRGRVGGLQLDQRAAMEIALRRNPLAALPAAPGMLFERNQPVTLGGGVVGKQVRVGRARALDDADSAQKIDPAARSVRAPSGPINR
jgi:hypothetical protein